MKQSLIVYSGGLDSTTLLWEYTDEIALAVNFHYGSNHNEREAECARRNCAKLGIKLIEIDLGFMSRHFKSSLLEGADAIPEGNYDDDNMRSTVVPFRNGIMLAVAAGLAESDNLSTILIANHSGDHAIYPDCRPGFVDAMGKAIAEGTYEGIRLSAPYTSLTKAEIVARGSRLGVDYSNTYSCYRGEERHCGTCGTCRERAEAFALAGVNDPTVYDTTSKS
jgi:7-cyano-7-deazaguanine synthase